MRRELIEKLTKSVQESIVHFSQCTEEEREVLMSILSGISNEPELKMPLSWFIWWCDYYKLESKSRKSA